jgi:hypothetical protein
MKRSLALALIACLVAAPAVMAQTNAPASPKVGPTGTPQGTAPGAGGGGLRDGSSDVAPTSAGNAQTGGKDAQKGQPAAKQDGKGAPPAGNADAMMKAWEEAAKPGPNHKLLEWFEGEWQAEVKDLSPGMESSDKGTLTCKMVYGGRFLSMDYDGRFHGKFFRGGGMWGYNNTDKKFESSWADSMGSMISYMTGTVSADKKVFTLSGDMTDPTAGKKISQKEVITITGKDTYKQEFFMGEQKVMEISYTKGKAEKREDKKDEKKEEKPKGK